MYAILSLSRRCWCSPSARTEIRLKTFNQFSTPPPPSARKTNPLPPTEHCLPSPSPPSVLLATALICISVVHGTARSRHCTRTRSHRTAPETFARDFIDAPHTSRRECTRSAHANYAIKSNFSVPVPREWRECGVEWRGRGGTHCGRSGCVQRTNQPVREIFYGIFFPTHRVDVAQTSKNRTRATFYMAIAHALPRKYGGGGGGVCVCVYAHVIRNMHMHLKIFSFIICHTISVSMLTRRMERHRTVCASIQVNGECVHLKIFH